ncbi:DUF6675 family protein [Breznakiella homolactica]|uniref:Uncharacterized protein n=1 Tax=Breznakiella homolactica TaxID=2798577 RepID=A0A7T7XQ20_9SPIR|nr:DUF6675 family protein [Breznakiella homolactica]QQO10288.1 hypothetical protein JFL75_05035 [Breznakiella homolactica]
MALNKKLILCLAGIAAALPVYSVSLEELVGPGRAEQLIRDGQITETQHKNPEPLMAPDSAFIRQLLEENKKAVEPSLMAESLYLYKKPDTANRDSWTEQERTALYNETLALSTLAGIEYFSTTRSAMRVFYETSSIIDNPDSKNPRSDPVYSIPPEKLTVYARQKDLTFGDNVYKYDYFFREDALIFIQENLTTMNSGPIPMVGKNKLRTVVAVLDAGPYLAVYISSMAKAPSIPGIGQRVGKSFSTRADAVLTWFTGQADKAYEKTR